MDKNLLQYHDFEACIKKEDLIYLRNRIAEAQKILKGYVKELDDELITRMKVEGETSFEIQQASGKCIVGYSKKTKEKVIDPVKLEKMLFSGNEREKALAKKCIPLSASAWKTAQVKVLCDTLGIEQSELIESKEVDELKIKIIPIEMLEKQGKI